MSNEQPLDRPATLKRAAKPAPDENIDPVDAAPQQPPAPATPPAATRAPKRREVTFPFSTRVSQPVLDVLDAVTAGSFAPSQRAAIEEAVLNYWGPKVKP